MRNPGLYIGVMVLSDKKDGGKKVASFTGQCYPEGMNDLEVAITEQILTNEFGAEFFELIKKVTDRMAEIGVEVGGIKVNDPEKSIADAVKETGLIQSGPVR